MIHLIDGNNYVRRLMELSDDGQTPRSIFYEMSNPQYRTFYVWDSENGNKARRDIFPGYKSKRPDLKEDIYVNFDIIRKALAHSKAIQVTIEGFEADDIIAALARSYAERGEKVHIFSTDRDFLQLMAAFPNHITATATLKTGVLLSDVRYHKTLVGDSSDSIPGIKGFGQKGWDDGDKEAMRRWLDAVTSNQEPGEFPAGGKAPKAWAALEENRQLLRDYWQIIGFLPITDQQVIENMVIGDGDYAAGDAVLKEMMQ